MRYKKFRNAIEDLNTTEFPPKTAFFDNIKQNEVNEELYECARMEYLRRLTLPDEDPDKFWSMRCYLKHYNLLG